MGKSRLVKTRQYELLEVFKHTSAICEL